MPKIRKKDKVKIEELRNRKRRTLEKTMDILRVICKDNPDIFKKAPEGRTKDLESIIKKMKTIPECNINNFEKYITDIAGARVTCCTEDEIEKVEKKIKKHPDVKNCKVIKGYKKGPDKFGYRGHHLLVTVQISYKNKTTKDTCEVQIRTLSQDLWAVLSHRDFYKAPSKPPPLVQKDMKVLSKLLEVVDNFAVSLKQRRREEIDREIREKQKKPMLIPENVQKLVKSIFKQEISVDFAYELIAYIMSNGVTSLKEYESLVKKHKGTIEKIFSKLEVEPESRDYLHGPIVLKTEGIRVGKEILIEVAKEEKEKRMQSVEKGVEMSKKELEKQKKVSQTIRRRNKK